MANGACWGGKHITLLFSFWKNKHSLSAALLKVLLYRTALCLYFPFLWVISLQVQEDVFKPLISIDVSRLWKPSTYSYFVCAMEECSQLSASLVLYLLKLCWICIFRKWQHNILVHPCALHIYIYFYLWY